MGTPSIVFGRNQYPRRSEMAERAPKRAASTARSQAELPPPISRTLPGRRPPASCLDCAGSTGSRRSCQRSANAAAAHKPPRNVAAISMPAARSGYPGATAPRTSKATDLCSSSSAACQSRSRFSSGQARSSTPSARASRAISAVKCSAAAVTESARAAGATFSMAPKQTPWYAPRKPRTRNPCASSAANHCSWARAWCPSCFSNPLARASSAGSRARSRWRWTERTKNRSPAGKSRLTALTRWVATGSPASQRRGAAENSKRGERGTGGAGAWTILTPGQ